MQVTLRQVQINHGVFQVRVSHEKLDRPQVGPASIRVVAKLWRSVCAPTVFLIPARFAASLQMYQIV
jgi:hypothetical protein